jgi:hypothetical protein
MQVLLTCSSIGVKWWRRTWTGFVSPCRQGATTAGRDCNGQTVSGVGSQAGGFGGTELTS